MNQEVPGSVRTDRPQDCVTHRTLLGNQPYISPHIRAPRSPHHRADERRARRALQWRRKKSPMTPSAVRNHHCRASVSWFAFRPGVFLGFSSPQAVGTKNRREGGWREGGWGQPHYLQNAAGLIFPVSKSLCTGRGETTPSIFYSSDTWGLWALNKPGFRYRPMILAVMLVCEFSCLDGRCVTRWVVADKSIGRKRVWRREERNEVWRQSSNDSSSPFPK